MTVARATIVVAALVTACASVEDVFGPAIGYAQLEGFVTSRGGNGISSVQVLLSTCSAPAIGEVGKAFTGRDGGYSMEAKLPPNSLVPPLPRDSVVLQCVLLAARDTSSIRQVDLWFWADQTRVTPVVIDLTIR